jgi:hypothetical protein
MAQHDLKTLHFRDLVELSVGFGNDCGIGISMFDSVAEVHHKPEDLLEGVAPLAPLVGAKFFGPPLSMLALISHSMNTLA